MPTHTKTLRDGTRVNVTTTGTLPGARPDGWSLNGKKVSKAKTQQWADGVAESIASDNATYDMVKIANQTTLALLDDGYDLPNGEVDRVSEKAAKKAVRNRKAR